MRLLFGIALVTLTAISGSRAFALDEAGFCARVTTEAASENKSAPYDIDAVTKGAGAIFDCSKRTFQSKRTLAVNSRDLTVGWQDKLTESWSQPFCADAAWHEAIVAGWVVKGQYTFSDGTAFVVAAKCPTDGGNVQPNRAEVKSGPVPSFDCAKAQTNTELAICSSYVLSSLDSEYVELYQRTRALDKKGLTRAEAIKLYRIGNACNGAETCIERNFTAGINFMAGFLRRRGQTVVTSIERTKEDAQAAATESEAERKRQEAVQKAEQQKRAELATAIAAARGLIDEASGFLKSDPNNPNVLQIATDIASLNATLTSEDLQKIETETTALSNAVHDDTRFADFMAARAIETTQENARHLADAVKLANQQKRFLISHIAQEPTAEASAAFVGEVKEIESASTSPDLAELRSLTDRIDASIVRYRLHDRFLASLNESGPTPGSPASAPGAAIQETVTVLNEFLVKGNLEDVVLMANSSPNSPHVAKNLRGDIVFDHKAATVCIFQKASDASLLGIVRSAFGRYQLETLQLDPAPCVVDRLLDYDVVAVRRGDFLRQDPEYALSLIKQIESQNFKPFVQVSAADIEDAAKARDAKRRQLETDVLNGSIDGYGLIILTPASSTTICAAVTSNRDGHQAVLDSLSDHFTNMFGVKPSPTTFMSSPDDAFFAIQHAGCAAVYASAKDLKDLFAALGREAIPFQLDENWITQPQVDDSKARADQNRSLEEQQNLDRARKQQEDRLMQALHEKDLGQTKSTKQAALQERYGPTAQAAAMAIANEVKGFTDSGGKDASFAASFPEFAAWYRNLLTDHWELISLSSVLLDYGQANWKNRTIEASLTSVSIKLRNQTLGEYRDACFVFGHVIDSEFSVSRDPIDATCDDVQTITSWKRGHAFQSQWIVD